MSTTVLSCMMQNTSFSHRPRNATLCIESARSYDEGVYVCVASNTLGQSRNTSVLRVAGNFLHQLNLWCHAHLTSTCRMAFSFFLPVSPIIVTFTSQVSCMVGASVDLPCRAVGILPINYTWNRGKAQTQSPIRPTGDRHIDGESVLRDMLCFSPDS